MVEEVHRSIVTLGGRRKVAHHKRPGIISGLVYNSIRGITGSVGVGLDVVLKRFTFLLDKQEWTPRHEAALAILNGVIGDYLEDNNNPLDIKMKFRRSGVQVNVNDPSFSEALQQHGGRTVLMIHGLCMNDLQWEKNGHNHGEKLQQYFGYLPLYLHYNTGLHISENGRKLATLMQEWNNSEQAPEKVLILAHSMGGLVIRSAMYYGMKAGHKWPEKINKMIFLGTPHHGAMLERGGNWIDNVLEKNAFTAPFSRIGKIRSSGVTDLRYGNILEEDWKHVDRFRDRGDYRIPVPLPSHLSCYAIAASTSKKANPKERLWGDGLVTPDSAFGNHSELKRNLQIPATHTWIARETSHWDLISQKEVYEKIKNWLS